MPRPMDTRFQRDLLEVERLSEQYNYGCFGFVFDASCGGNLNSSDDMIAHMVDTLHFAVGIDEQFDRGEGPQLSELCPPKIG